MTDGADFQYALTYGLQINGGLNESVAAWTRGVYLRSVEKGMEAARMGAAPSSTRQLNIPGALGPPDSKGNPLQPPTPSRGPSWFSVPSRQW